MYNFKLNGLPSLCVVSHLLTVFCMRTQKKKLHYEDKADVVRGDQNFKQFIASTKLTTK